MDVSLRVLCYLILTLYVSERAFAIDCYQCNSNEQTHCSESFNPEGLEVEPESCDHIHEAKYCVKATGMYEGTIGTRRFCSSRHHGNYCEYVRRPGDERDYRSCVFTCYRDGCNTGTEIGASLTSIVVLVVSVVLLRYV